MDTTWLQLAVVGLLVGFLFWKQYQREQTRLVERVRHMTGRGFASTEVKARLDELRRIQRFLANSGQRKSPAHEVYVTAVRSSLRQLSFFRLIESNQPAHHGSETSGTR